MFPHSPNLKRGARMSQKYVLYYLPKTDEHDELSQFLSDLQPLIDYIKEHALVEIHFESDDEMIDKPGRYMKILKFSIKGEMHFMNRTQGAEYKLFETEIIPKIALALGDDVANNLVEEEFVLEHACPQ
ncbi:MAG: hypothetical protein ACI9TY_001192 [Alphaproteobacteria bacterium]|jgi:hypothetical protein